VFVKICGITNEQDALVAVAMGADAIGFIFAPSPRQVAAGAVAGIVRRLPHEVITVGVFRDAHPERVVDVVRTAGLRAAQLHGHESPEEVAFVAERVPLVIKAFAAASPSVDEASSYRADAVMIDAPSPGSGKVFDWRLAEGLPRTRRLILAGGLDPTNVAEAIRRVHPWGVDVSSGVEFAPGHKDARLVRAFIQAARSCESEPHDSQFDAPYDWQEEES
jgi:phosphoribosylanthranilate isomerase